MIRRPTHIDFCPRFGKSLLHAFDGNRSCNAVTVNSISQSPASTRPQLEPRPRGDASHPMGHGRGADAPFFRSSASPLGVFKIIATWPFFILSIRFGRPSCILESPESACLLRNTLAVPRVASRR